MMGPNKYKFNNVLVADTKILLPMLNNSSDRPELLILNSKLNKCSNNTTNCISCCLQIEQSEFRRRSESDSEGACLANCGERRAIDIELTTESRLNGKLVVLALTRNKKDLYEQSGLSTNSSNVINKCKVNPIWAYSRFEPSANEVTRRKTYYSRPDENQVASMTFDSIELRWDQQLQREVVSMSLQPVRRKKTQQIITGEAILISRLNCHLVNNFGEYLNLTNSTRTIHLLTIINRQISQVASGKQGATSTKTIEQSTTEIPPESYIDFPQAAVTQSKRDAPIQLIRPDLFVDRSTNKQPTIDQRFDLGDQFKNLNNLYAPNLSRLATDGNITRINPSILSEVNSFRYRLKSNSFLVLTVSSSFVILTYTLCLLIYLKSRQRFRSRRSRANNCSNLNQANNNSILPATTSSSINEISKPYNLQMSSATQTRLNVMLGGGCSTFKSDEYSRGQETRIGDRTKPKKTKKKTKRRLIYEQEQHYYRPPEPLFNEHGCDPIMLNATSQMQAHYPNESHLPFSLYYGTTNVMRAIRQAATIARVKLRNSRYRPNLNSIPESELEQLHSLRLVNGETTNQDNDVYLSPEHLNEFLRNAMSQNCIHSASDYSYNRPVETLFSIPIEEQQSVEDQVSRSRILRHVKEDSNLYNQTDDMFHQHVV